MGCYVLPTLAAIVHYGFRKKIPSMNTKYQSWLNQLFLGGSIFGLVDHLWNGQLLAFSAADMALGVLITCVILAAWGIMVYVDKNKVLSRHKSIN